MSIYKPALRAYLGGDIASKKGGSIVVALNNAHSIVDYIIKNS